MGRKIQEIAIFALTVFILASPSFAQKRKERADSEHPESELVRLTKAESIELLEIDGCPYRKSTKATFKHNGMTLICDTALWNIDQKLIDAKGHVRLIQGDVTLSSEKLQYDIDASVARFRGELVQLRDKKDNTLRTVDLDYNTKDSLAIFRNGGAMRSEDGQVMEGLCGSYDLKEKLFSFQRDVNLFSDSIFVRTEKLEYRTELRTAFFPSPIDFWKDDNMLSARNGWYNKEKELFYFDKNVHAQTPTQEAWCDSMYFYRDEKNVLLMGRSQVQDTSRNVTAVARRIFFEEKTSTVTMTDQAAIAFRTESEGQADTVYCGADKLLYRSVRKCDVPESEFALAKTRLEDLLVDPVAIYRQKAAEAAAEAAAKNMESSPARFNRPNPGVKKEQPATVESLAPADTLAVPDTLATTDSTALAKAAADSLAAAVDTVSKIGFLYGLGDVKVFREDMQMRCDSLVYTDIDSVARFYIDPVIWNEGTRQYSADSLHALIRGGIMDRVGLLSNSIVISQEDTLYYDQVKGTEMMAYFDAKSQLRRFDALGGASAIFYLEENDRLATVNKVESKMLSAVLQDGEIDRITYFDKTKNDAFPLVQLKEEEHYLKGFRWDAERRPMRREDITTLKVRKSQRSRYDTHPKASFPYTAEYFPGYIEGVYEQIEESRLRKQERENTPVDSLYTADSISVAAADSIVVEEAEKKAAELAGAVGATAAAGTVAAVAGSEAAEKAVKDAALAGLKDSLLLSQPDSVAVSDSLSNMSAAQKRRDEAEQKRQAREEAKQAKWDELDKRDAAKAQQKKEKKQARKREQNRKLLIQKQIQDQKDAAKLQRYIDRFEARKSRKALKTLKP